MNALNLENLGPEITWHVTVGTEQYGIQAYSGQSAVRMALMVFLDVQMWSDEGQVLFMTLGLEDILEALPEALEVYAVPDVEGEFEEDEDEDEDEGERVLN